MADYEVKTAILIDTGFDDRECNSLMYDGWKEKMGEDIRKAFAGDEALAGYITSDLNFLFIGYKVKLEYTFSCNDDSEQEAEDYAVFCLKGIQQKLEEVGYHIEKITCRAGAMDMEWLDKLEDSVFHS